MDQSNNLLYNKAENLNFLFEGLKLNKTIEKLDLKFNSLKDYDLQGSSSFRENLKISI